jgi:hypothetical protein
LNCELCMADVFFRLSRSDTEYRAPPISNGSHKISSVWRVQNMAANVSPWSPKAPHRHEVRFREPPHWRGPAVMGADRSKLLSGCKAS